MSLCLSSPTAKRLDLILLIPAHRICSGFDRVLLKLNDTRLDTPDAPAVLGQFIARAVADELLPPIYVTSRPGPQDSREAAEAFSKARGLIANPQGLHRLIYIWGCSGGLSTISDLRGRISLLLQEYLQITDRSEALQCIRDLHAAHFHHEVVYQAIELAIDGRDERDMLDLSALLKEATRTLLISEEQLEKGVRRILDNMNDLVLDVPHAPARLETFCSISTAFHLLSSRLQDEAKSVAESHMV